MAEPEAAQEQTAINQKAVAIAAETVMVTAEMAAAVAVAAAMAVAAMAATTWQPSLIFSNMGVISRKYNGIAQNHCLCAFSFPPLSPLIQCLPGQPASISVFSVPRPNRKAKQGKERVRGRYQRFLRKMARTVTISMKTYRFGCHRPRPHRHATVKEMWREVVLMPRVVYGGRVFTVGRYIPYQSELF